MKELNFNQIKNKIHLKPCILNVKRKDKIDYEKKWKHDKLTFYKEYKPKMLWFNKYGLGLDNLSYAEIEENKHYQIESDKILINIKILNKGE